MITPLNNTAIILADNQDLSRAGMRSFALRVFNGGHIEEVSSKKTLVKEMEKYRSGIVVLDYTTFDFKGIDDFLILHNRFDDFAWVLCSLELSEDFMRRAAVEENIGVVFKDSPGDEIIKALEAAASGSRRHCSRAEALLSTERGHLEIAEVLTATEMEILRMIARGKSVKEIAAERISSTHTIITHKKNIFRKLGVNNVYEATKYALRAGLLEMMEYYI
ncbi:MAG: response regulator transcription factor [Muribaculaceae bacterium]|nr:response regulator transcription factor [Muribaculaceae bacterium]